MRIDRDGAVFLLAVSAAACASVPPQRPLSTHSLKGIAAVRVEASGTKLRVFQARDTLSPLALVGLIGPATEALIDKSRDNSAAGRVEPQAGEASAVSVLRNHFVERLRVAGVFRRVECAQPCPPASAGDGIAGVADPLAEDPRARGLITLRLADISLRTGRAADSLRLQLGVHATMTRPGFDAPFWERHETVFADEEHPLGYYAQNGLPMLRPLASKVADRLADDIIYSR
jgi:hypothetical protein